MARWRHAVELAMTDEVIGKLTEISRSREGASRVARRRCCSGTLRSRRSTRFARDHEYNRYGTLSLLAGIDLLTGKVHALVRDRHRSRELIEFLQLLDAAYPASTAIKPIFYSAISRARRECTGAGAPPVRPRSRH
jgi:hypothetical protein